MIVNAIRGASGILDQLVHNLKCKQINQGENADDHDDIEQTWALMIMAAMLVNCKLTV